MPCCRQQQLQDPCDLAEDFVCNHLNGEICEPLSGIRNLDQFIKLTKNLNSTNIIERTILYRKIAGLNTMDSTMSYVVWFCAACLLVYLLITLGYHARLTGSYAHVPSNDIPLWN